MNVNTQSNAVCCFHSLDTRQQGSSKNFGSASGNQRLFVVGGGLGLIIVAYLAARVFIGIKVPFVASWWMFFGVHDGFVVFFGVFFLFCFVLFFLPFFFPHP